MEELEYHVQKQILRHTDLADKFVLQRVCQKWNNICLILLAEQRRVHIYYVPVDSRNDLAYCLQSPINLNVRSDRFRKRERQRVTRQS